MLGVCAPGEKCSNRHTNKARDTHKKGKTQTNTKALISSIDQHGQHAWPFSICTVFPAASSFPRMASSRRLLKPLSLNGKKKNACQGGGMIKK